jgi:bifunctional ADP-heptose synthase (sugar kinase/adenylyltransferase)
MEVTIIGEICDDIFIYGDVKRLSPEAPIPILTHTHVEKNLGMAGNVQMNLQKLNPSIIVNIINQTEKIKKTRFVDEKSNHMFLRLDEGDENIKPLKLSNDHINKIKNSDFVIVSDYNKGFLTEKILIKIAEYSKLSFLDTKKTLTDKVVKKFDFIKLNEFECFNNKKLYTKYKDKFIITLGMKGSKYNNIIYPSTNPKQTMDVSGAGDTFTASFSLKFYETKNIEESIYYANEMASIVVSKRGVSTP